MPESCICLNCFVYVLIVHRTKRDRTSRMFIITISLVVTAPVIDLTLMRMIRYVVLIFHSYLVLWNISVLVANIRIKIHSILTLLNETEAVSLYQALLSYFSLWWKVGEAMIQCILCEDWYHSKVCCYTASIFFPYCISPSCRAIYYL